MLQRLNAQAIALTHPDSTDTLQVKNVQDTLAEKREIESECEEARRRAAGSAEKFLEAKKVPHVTCERVRLVCVGCADLLRDLRCGDVSPQTQPNQHPLPTLNSLHLTPSPLPHPFTQDADSARKKLDKAAKKIET